MTMLHTLPRSQGDHANVNVFDCRQCKVTFTTEDHLPVTGQGPFRS
jgi:hypothetical protein